MLVICVCACCHFSHVWLSATLWTVFHQATLTMGFSRQEYWSGLPYSPPGDLPGPGIELMSPVAPALKVDSLSLNHQGSWLLYIPSSFILIYGNCLSAKSIYSRGLSSITAALVPNIKFCDRFQNIQAATDILSFDHHTSVNGRNKCHCYHLSFQMGAWDSGRWNNELKKRQIGNKCLSLWTSLVVQ